MTKTLLIFFFGSLLLFAAVMPENHSEAEDAFEYSRLIEEGTGAEQFHPRHLLYVPMQKAVYGASQRLGYSGRSYYSARAVSMFSGASVLCLFYLIVRRVLRIFFRKEDHWISVTAVLGLLFSYGFIRYACEVEIYVPALALLLAAIYCALRNESWVTLLFSILFSALAVLMHMVNVVPAVLAVPLLYAMVFRNRRRAWIHGIATLALVGSVCFIIQHSWGTQMPGSDPTSEGGVSWDTVPKAIVGLGQCLLSANFIFTYSSVAEKLQSFFPYRMFDEEIFTALQVPGWLKLVAPVTFALAVAGLMLLLVRLLFSFVRAHSCKEWRPLLWILVWTIGVIFPTVWVEPSNPELWIMGLPPFWLLGAWFVRQVSWRRVFVWVVCLFGLHNLVSGMGIVKGREGDYLFRKAEWVLQHAGPDDVINTADTFVFSFYLDYWSPAEIRNLNTQEWNKGRVTYVLNDVFDPPGSVEARFPEQALHAAQAARELEPLCHKVHDDPFGGVWSLNEPVMKE
ncbi:MAG: glycosyltransferase family 39 protein [Pontiellaceae bacterium]|nr:glycosyltransferase family 39 protein [Pontiellaceae bacterium]